jgi:hypothetical protein
MRTLLALASLTVLIGAASGCGDDTTSGSADMTMTADLHAPAGDMAKLNCGQLLTCVGACTSQTCAGQCVAGASATAVTKAGTLAKCINGVCGPVDGGSGACPTPGDTSAGCMTCEQNAVGATGTGPCGPAYAACQADM